VGAGHAARARVDTFLQNWLSKETALAVSPKHLYDRFLRYAEKLRSQSADNFDLSGFMASIHADALRFKQIDRPTGNRRFDLFLERLKRLDILVFHPLLLEVMAQTEDDPSDAGAFGEILESYLVRRLICGAQTRSYGTLMLTILKRISLAAKSFARSWNHWQVPMNGHQTRPFSIAGKNAGSMVTSGATAC
jgi:hypothetical protein